MKCKICEKEMETWEGNNPQPILPKFEDRVCRECNCYVTATRMMLAPLFSQFDASIQDVLYRGLASMIGMSYTMKESQSAFEDWRNKNE